MNTTCDSKKILIIDDKKDIVELITNILKGDSYETIGTTRWTDALEVLGRESPALILVDLKMPTIDGASIIEFIRNQGMGVPIIVVSAFVTDEVVKKLSTLGVCGFVRKPFGARFLRDEIDRVLSSHSIPDTTPLHQGTLPKYGSVSSLYDEPFSSIPEISESLDSTDLLGPAGAEPLPEISDAKNEAEILRAFEKQSTDSESSIASSPNEEVLQASALPSNSIPLPKTESKVTQTREAIQGSAAQPTSHNPNVLAVTKRPQKSSRRRPPHRSISTNFIYMSVITLVCILVSGFLAAMQYLESEVDFTEVQKNAQESIRKQATKQILNEIQK